MVCDVAQDFEASLYLSALHQKCSQVGYRGIAEGGELKMPLSSAGAPDFFLTSASPHCETSREYPTALLARRCTHGKLENPPYLFWCYPVPEDPSTFSHFLLDLLSHPSAGFSTKSPALHNFKFNVSNSSTPKTRTDPTIMVRNIVVLGGNSHPQLTDMICNTLGVPQCQRILKKFSVGESRLEIEDSVREKDVYIIQSGCGKANDNFVELCIMISACKTGSARRVTAVLPLFPYSRQPDIPYNKIGAPLSKAPTDLGAAKDYTFESRPATPGPGQPQSQGLFNGEESLQKKLSKIHFEQAGQVSPKKSNGASRLSNLETPPEVTGRPRNSSASSQTAPFTTHDYQNSSIISQTSKPYFQAKPGYKQWVAQAGTLVADLLTCAGADHIITMDLHDPQYQGFFDIPVDNLYGKPLIKRYIQQNIPDFRDAVIVSPDAGGAKRATAIADGLNMDFALIHKVGFFTLKPPSHLTNLRNAGQLASPIVKMQP
jgi:ribose-phosphate pyrophosphokinase